MKPYSPMDGTKYILPSLTLVLASLLSHPINALSADGQSSWNLMGTWPDLTWVIKSFSGTMSITVTNQDFISGKFQGFQNGTDNAVQGVLTGDSIQFTAPQLLSVNGYFSGKIAQHCVRGGNGFPGELTITDTGGQWHGFWQIGQCKTDDHVFEPITPPTFTSQPSGIVTNLGAAVRFNAIAKGDPAPTYQWYFQGQPLGGSTNSALILGSTSPTNAGTYFVVASNPFGTITSSNAELMFLDIKCVPALQIIGPVRQSYEIQGTANLTAPQWETISIVTVDANQPYLFTDVGATTNGFRFYRTLPIQRSASGSGR